MKISHFSSVKVAKYISSELNQNRDTQDKQHQYTIYKEGGPGFTRYIVYMDNKASRDNNVISNVNMDNMSREVNRIAMKRHKSLPPRERRKTGVGFAEGIVVTLLLNSFHLVGNPDNKMFYHQMQSTTSQEE